VAIAGAAPPVLFVVCLAAITSLAILWIVVHSASFQLLTLLGIASYQSGLPKIVVVVLSSITAAGIEKLEAWATKVERSEKTEECEDW
jgi:hypothetical protein